MTSLFSWAHCTIFMDYNSFLFFNVCAFFLFWFPFFDYYLEYQYTVIKEGVHHTLNPGGTSGDKMSLMNERKWTDVSSLFNKRNLRNHNVFILDTSWETKKKQILKFQIVESDLLSNGLHILRLNICNFFKDSIWVQQHFGGSKQHSILLYFNLL